MLDADVLALQGPKRYLPSNDVLPASDVVTSAGFCPSPFPSNERPKAQTRYNDEFKQEAIRRTKEESGRKGRGTSESVLSQPV